MQRADWEQLADQLATLPGGAAAALPDFFGTLVSDELAPITSDWDYDGWVLKAGGILSLRINDAVDGMRLFYVTPDDELGIARAGSELLHVAREKQVPAIVLMLLAVYFGMHIGIALIAVSFVGIGLLRSPELAARMIGAAANCPSRTVTSPAERAPARCRRPRPDSTSESR